jgi:hypothetical protein
MLYKAADSQEPVSVASSHYRDQLFREAERIYKTKTGTALAIDRNMLEVYAGREEGEYVMETRVRAGRHYTHISYYVNPMRSIERNAWAIGQIVSRKIGKGLTL